MTESSVQNQASEISTVKVYSTPVCPYCQMAKDFLKKNNIAYQEIDVSKNEQSFQEMVQRSGQMGVPVLDVKGTIVVGFNRRAIAQLLDIQLDL
ncbi:MAG: Glutaredoxin-like protein, YruB-family [Parcubacteria group bacterium GW2011_GWB1_46_8]|nr:MAG: Glutaredoxin-like protein, YruB-family [Parcubacteria group bacterium GW2011_GWF1_45_5]KKU11325.1 MAG: Glutaredoxin-like protein, YruB-family [Parcubacteria group bacterium GW2011_GWA1_45_7]KKU43946.1 MAG: Glutaredoxin-like protein, YruB-family [Parcubacteria group bacterium GW2011_GWA2_46_7]KKU46244.1 MAG: Glutaredoxin-like protein, YruB-family [Parcubacteria group bacterium GW2011_GWB1_46_8]KKU47187.1 MAG: Glutaredoxin-like protein, YruB-family [Parcubacteria group bacterium GW2011_GW